jgi:hypothetical protein
MRKRLLLSLSLLQSGAASAGEPEVKAITVPPELGAMTSNPELSGVVWSPAFRRYLLVSDDSGLREKGSNHEPILLGLGPDGALDKTTIPIRGVRKLNDPESICAGPDGTLFVVTSHSPNREGRTPAPRRQLLQLKPDKGAMRVVASLDLTNIKGDGSLLSLVDLPTDGVLDIEAVTYHDDALFVGFKSPLTSQGQAVIARIRKPLAALRAGRVEAKAVERFLAAPLCVDEKGQRVCQGISDMAFLPDGSLVLTANAPKGGPKDHGGALWHLSKPVEKATPVMLRRFPGLKPEGVTLAANGRALVVVFDTDTAIPKWLEIPLPATGK